MFSHNDSNVLSYEEICALPTPEATDTWQPVPHKEVIDAVRLQAAERGYTINKETFALSKEKEDEATGVVYRHRLFAVFRLGVQDDAGAGEFFIAVRNTSDRRFAFSVVGGHSVFVCDNLCFSGEWKRINRKHTSGINVREVVSAAFGTIPEQIQSMNQDIQAFKRTFITDEQAAYASVQLALMGVITDGDVVKVVEIYEAYLDGEHSHHSEFAARNLWSLLNAVTELAKAKEGSRQQEIYQRVLLTLKGVFPQQYAKARVAIGQMELNFDDEEDEKDVTDYYREEYDEDYLG